jgi:hypothetical protein
LAVITRAYSETDGDIAEASSINRVIDDLYTLQNGNIGGGNLVGSGVLAAAIGNTAVLTRHINDCAVTSPKIANSGVLASNIADGVIATALGYGNTIFTQEIY